MVRLVRAAGGEVHIQVEQRFQNNRASVYPVRKPHGSAFRRDVQGGRP
jgi:hypothetical protein